MVRRALSWLAASLKSLLPRGVGPRLSLLMLAATGPLLALLVLSAIADGRRVLDTARAQVVQLARLAAEQQGDMVQEASGLLRVPEIQSLSDATCDGLQRAVVSDHARINGLAVAGADGVIGCSANPAAKTLNVADLDWFTRLSNGPGGFAEPLVQVLDSRDGAMLAQAPNIGGQIGQRFPDHPVIAAYRAAQGGGSVQAAGLDGVGRIFGFAPLSGHAAGLVVAISLKEADIRAAADQRFQASTAVALLAAGLAALMSWPIATLSVLRPVNALMTAAALVGSGDLNARATMGRGAANELRSLGAAFTRMAVKLQARDSRIAALQREIALSESHRRLLAENANDMITRLSPEFQRLYVSPACRDLLGYEPDEMVGEHPGGMAHPDDQEALHEALDGRLLAGQATARASYRARHKDGRYIWLETSGRRLDDGSGFIAVTRDVSERKALEAQLEAANQRLGALARQDALTGLPNRRRFDEALGDEYRRAMRVESPLAVIMVDVDRFKSFNDIYGHPRGDDCLRALADAINGLARRPADLPARYGGQAFVLLLPNTDAVGALALAERIRARVCGLEIPHAGSDSGFATVSLGVAVMLPDAAARGPAALIEAADAALYAAKCAGRNTVRLTDARAAALAS